MHHPALRRHLLPSLAMVVFVLGVHAVAEEPLPNVERLQTSPVLRSLQPNPLRRPPNTGPEKTVAQMYLPPGFRAELVVAEPDLHQPVAFTFDERGRIWVAEAYTYPTKRPAGEGQDKLVIFEDRDGDGRFETRKVFAEGLNLVSGFEIGHGGAWVGAAPELLFIPDRNQDDLPDGPPEVLLDGFGYQDTHECLNSFMWGPDGWLYGNQGVFNLAHIGKPGTSMTNRAVLRAGVWRYHPVRRVFEVFAEGGSNQWGLDYDEHGQIFMTHCRSYWGRGPTTHVVQGGYYWNQANANYPPFIVANPPKDYPGYRNYLLASARYDHGAGGAGVVGSDAIYGGHSHVGTMIYLGDNWPDEFRGHLFTHNLHGHQINHQVNRRLGSGFDTVHGGQDVFFCSDPKYVAVDLQYGPDGAVYSIDWYDQQHCHNPNTERWDRANGRVYRMQYEATYQPRKVNLGVMKDEKLVELLSHKNAWFARTARRLLQERSQRNQGISPDALQDLRLLGTKGRSSTDRLQALWTLSTVGGLSETLVRSALKDEDEFVRAWAARLVTDTGEASARIQKEFIRMARTDPSPVVRLHLAAAIQRIPDETAWALIESLSSRSEDGEDRAIPLMVWFGLAQRMPPNVERALAIAKGTKMPRLADWIHWYAATLPGPALNHAIGRLSEESGDSLRRRLAGIELAMATRANVPMPEDWNRVAARLYGNSDPAVVRQAERIAATFGDDSMFPRLREVLANPAGESSARQHAFAVLSRAMDRESVATFLQLLAEPAFRSPALKVLGRFDSPEIARVLIKRYQEFPPSDRAVALNALVSRASFAQLLLDAVAEGQLKRDQLTAFHVRQLIQLKNPEVDKRVTATWGRIQQTPAEKLSSINRLEKTFAEAPLWAYSAIEGRKHFQKLCASCHRLRDEGTMLGPDLTGAGKNGIRYFLENVLDPDAVIGTDFQMTTVETRQGDVVSGLITGETGSALTIRTTTGETIIPKADIAERATSEKSLMPEGLIESLNEREQLELLKFLTTN